MLVGVSGLVQIGLILIKNTVFNLQPTKYFIIDIQSMLPLGKLGMRNSCSSSKSQEVHLTFFFLSVSYSVSLSLFLMNIFWIPKE